MGLLTLFPTKVAPPGPPPGLPQPAFMNWNLASDTTITSGSNVIVLTDQTGNGNSVTFSNSTAAPQLIPSQFGAENAVQLRGDSEGNFLVNTRAFWDPTAPFSITMVGKTLATLTTGNYYLLVNAVGTNPATTAIGIFIYNASGTTTIFIYNGVSSPESITFPFDPNYLSDFSMTMSYNGGGFSSTSNFIITVNGTFPTLTYNPPSAGGLFTTNILNNSSVPSVIFNLGLNVSWHTALTSFDVAQASAYTLTTYGV